MIFAERAIKINVEKIKIKSKSAVAESEEIKRDNSMELD
jgi:hypothetical protein